jgi:hypothetical protein
MLWPRNQGRNRSESGRAVLLALAASLALLSWQFLTVHYNYGGNWTGLFCIERGKPVPGFLKSENLYLFQHGSGYDGMVYHLIAHDPWMRKGSADVILGASFRYQRILVPALAWLVAFGQDRWIHPAYFGVILAFAFLGVYWLSLFASRAGLAPAWGLAFVLTPATITSIDRMTVDIALAALTAGFALYVSESPDWRVLVLLACAALTRETGALIILGYAIYLFAKKNIRGGLLAASTVAPAAAWFLFLSNRETSTLPTLVTWVPLAGFIRRVSHPSLYHLPAIERIAGQVFDVIALAGVALALFYAARLLIRRSWDARSAVICVLAVAAVFLGSDAVWYDAYAFGRVLTPFLLLTALVSIGIRPLAAFLPMILIDARIGLNFVSQIAGVVRGLTGL